MFTDFEIIIDETIINKLTDSKQKEQILSLLRYIDFRRFSDYCKHHIIETTPRIMNILKNKVKEKDPELYFMIKNFIKENNIASEEEGLTMEQEIIDLVNNCIPLNPNVVLITENEYKPSKDKQDNIYQIQDTIILIPLEKFNNFTEKQIEFKDFLGKFIYN